MCTIYWLQYSNNYSRKSGSWLQYYIHEPALTGAGANSNFYDANASGPFKFWQN